MSSTAEHQELQFDRAVKESSSDAARTSPSALCAACQTSIDSTYFQVNGSVFCAGCRSTVEATAATPRGAAAFLAAALFGLGAGIVGAIIYYAVMAIANLEIGIIAILIGYMVGYAVRKGAGGRGGRRFQVLAVALTYAAVAFAYTPIAVREVFKRDTAETSAASPASNPESPTAGVGPVAAEPDARVPAATTSLSGGRVIAALAFMLAFIAALPVLVVVGSFPSGLISAFIIFIGMRQAWRMTGAPKLEILGPYRVGAGPTSTPA